MGVANDMIQFEESLMRDYKNGLNSNKKSVGLHASIEVFAQGDYLFC